MTEWRWVERGASALLVTGGLLLIAAGQGAPASADPCVQGGWIEPAECIAAHVDIDPHDRVGGAAGGCSFSQGSCIGAGAGCDPVPKFNSAENGKCQAFIGGSDITRCAEDAQKTAITLTKLTGACDSVNGDCACRYTPVMPVETLNVEVCNCKQEKR